MKVLLYLLKIYQRIENLRFLKKLHIRSTHFAVFENLRKRCPVLGDELDDGSFAIIRKNIGKRPNPQLFGLKALARA